jgi:hypothetical protein
VANDDQWSDRPMISVILGRVSTEDDDRVLETIAAFGGNNRVSYEIVIADRIRDAVSERIRREFPAVRLVDCAPHTALPEMRTLALDASVGDLVAVTEDHCVPAPGWLDIASNAFAVAGPTVVAIGGAVENGVADTGLDWATFLCEYSFFSPPVAEGQTDVLPGMNIVYRRSALLSVPREKLIEGFWETTVHPLLLRQGHSFLSLNALKMYHCKKFSASLFLRQRFVYSRYFAGIRFKSSGWPMRLAAAAATAVLPPILFVRMVSAARAKRLTREFVRAVPSLIPMILVWSAGEAYGALAGPGNALAEIE